MSEKKRKPILADLSPVFGKRQYMPIACYLFGNVIILDLEDESFFLCLTEDRKESNIWTPFGGEIEYFDCEQFPEGAAREVLEESGVAMNPKNLIFLDSRIVYPMPENDYYVGVTMVINSYLYILKREDSIPSIEAQTPEDECNVIDIKKFPLSKLREPINEWEINVFSNFEKTLKKLGKYVEKNLER